MEIIFWVEDSVDGGFDASAIGYSIFTQAETQGALRETVRDAVNTENASAPTFLDALHRTGILGNLYIGSQ